MHEGTSADPRRVTLAVDGMSCGHCVSAVATALQGVAGVTVDQVSIGAATVSLDPTPGARERTLDAALRAVGDAGFDARVADRGGPEGAGGCGCGCGASR